MVFHKAILLSLLTVISSALPQIQQQRPFGPVAFSDVSLQASVTPLNRNATLESSRRLSRGAEQFALEILTKFSDALTLSNTRRDFMISPFAVWSLLLLLQEGADGKTLQQLRAALHTDEDQQALRKAYRDVQNYLRLNTSTIEVASLQAVFTDINQPVQRDFENIIERDYNSQLFPVNFHDPEETTRRINDEVHRATRGLIPYSVLPQDLKDANLFLLSSLFFKGQWKNPFNTSLTRTEPFYDEDGKPIGNVQMMVQEANFNYAGINELEGHVLELPYGKENRLSMLIILPKVGVSINKVVHNLKAVTFGSIFERLNTAAQGFEDENVEVFMPKFTTESDFSLMSILQEMGILDIFDPNVANLSKMSTNVFVSQIIHSTKIIVDEKGTVAAAVASAVLANKLQPPRFYLNRPFLYLIIEKSTNLLLFAGQVINPNYNKT